MGDRIKSESPTGSPRNAHLARMIQHYAMLQRNLNYTGVTRDEQLVVWVWQKKAVAIAVKNVAGRQRW